MVLLSKRFTQNKKPYGIVSNFILQIHRLLSEYYHMFSVNNLPSNLIPPKYNLYLYYCTYRKIKFVYRQFIHIFENRSTEIYSNSLSNKCHIGPVLLLQIFIV